LFVANGFLCVAFIFILLFTFVLRYFFPRASDKSSEELEDNRDKGIGASSKSIRAFWRSSGGGGRLFGIDSAPKFNGVTGWRGGGGVRGLEGELR
jgi:hypothetical protein